MDAVASALPFSDFAPPTRPQSALREAITAACRRPEEECLAPLLEQASLPFPLRAAIQQTAEHLVQALRAKRQDGGVETLIQEFALSSQEGVALMCLAEALLRIPDTATRDVLIREKIGKGNWKSHLGADRPLFTNAAVWGLAVTGRLTTAVSEGRLSSALARLIARCGEPVVRRGVDLAMRLMGEQYVAGQTIEEALRRARTLEQKGFAYSYDMLGEAAATAQDADRYYRAYVDAISAIGKASAGRGVYAGPGISIKLSALHPRYCRAQAGRVMGELLPRVKSLAALARSFDVGLNIDAEEADRLDLSLDLLEDLALDPDLANWDGLGFVVQAYGRRCPFVLDFVIDLAKRSGRRLMVRLVKGAYWDSEIKRAQAAGLSDFPVYTRKVHTDVAYIACARKLLAATEYVFPQFATHNAQTVASIYHLAGADFHLGRYEFQCLHGMGEPLYREVVGDKALDRPCRVYAPVGTHETLLAYLVRRLLENGANSSFVNRIGDCTVAVDELVVDPAAEASAEPTVGRPHHAIAAPGRLYAPRLNSEGLDLADEAVLARLSAELAAGSSRAWRSEPLSIEPVHGGACRLVINPANLSEIVGEVVEADEQVVGRAALVAEAASGVWEALPVAERAACLERAAEQLQAQMIPLVGLIVREAGRTVPNAVDEVREAIDFLRYYADEARRTLGPTQRALGPIACISPWNFPLAIFIGQVAAALVAGNPVLAKPAEETPLVAGEAVRILHQAGIPRSALQFLPGDGQIGALLVDRPEVAGVMFTGSTAVARLIQQQLSRRLSVEGKPLPLIAETGGQNAMIVDSSALPEQVVQDVIASAFDSAGQRCSGLRLLCLQEEVADKILDMLKGAVGELLIGRPDRLAADIGPVISAEAQSRIEAHVDALRRQGRAFHQHPLPAGAANGYFLSPAIIELQQVAELHEEVFGPVLHVIRFKRPRLGKLLDDINATGYGLTVGVHSRLDETIDFVRSRSRAGNVYVNRNMIGAVVGVQPFGGHGLSGTGPKAGGPLYLGRLVSNPLPIIRSAAPTDPALAQFADWLARGGFAADAKRARRLGEASPLGFRCEMPSIVGESNLYELQKRGRVLVFSSTLQGQHHQVAACLATGNTAVVALPPNVALSPFAGAPALVASRALVVEDWQSHGPYGGVLIEGDSRRVAEVSAAVAAKFGPEAIIQAATSDEIAADPAAYQLDWLVSETSTSINTAAAGGNASLMTLA